MHISNLQVLSSRLIFKFIRESSFNMTKGGGMKILRGGLWKFLDTQKGALKKLGGGGAPKKLNR